MATRRFLKEPPSTCDEYPIAKSGLDYFKRGEWENPRFWSRLGGQPDLQGKTCLMLYDIAQCLGLAEPQISDVLGPRGYLFAVKTRWITTEAG